MVEETKTEPVKIEAKKEELPKIESVFEKVEDCPEQERSCLLFGCPREVNDSIIQDKFAKDGVHIVSIKNKLMSNISYQMMIKEGSAIIMKLYFKVKAFWTKYCKLQIR